MSRELDELIHEKVMQQEIALCRQHLRVVLEGDILGCRGCQQTGTQEELTTLHNMPVPRYSETMSDAWPILALANQEKLVHVSETYTPYHMLKRFCYAFTTGRNPDYEDVDAINPYDLTIGIDDLATFTAKRIVTAALLAIGVAVPEKAAQEA